MPGRLAREMPTSSTTLPNWPQPPPPAAPAANIAATSNFTFVVQNNVAEFTPAVEQKVAEQLAADLQVPASQVTLATPPAITVGATVQLAAFPPGREADVQSGIVEYLGAGDAGAGLAGGWRGGWREGVGTAAAAQLVPSHARSCCLLCLGNCSSAPHPATLLMQPPA